MFNPLPLVIFTILAVAGWAALGPGVENPVMIAAYAGWLAISTYIASMPKIAAQWEKALVFRLGRFSKVTGPGIFWILPLIDSFRTVDTRIQTLDIPRQEAITKDNVPLSLDGVIFLRVNDPADAVIRVQHYQHAIRQYAQTALRDVVGAATLDEILADREELGHRIEKMVEVEVAGWGLEVAAIRLQDIILPEDLKRVMSRQAAAEREKRANITKSEGDREAAENLAAAAETMATAPGALQLRTLQTLDSLGGSSSNTVVMAIPVDVMTALQAIPKLMPNRQAQGTDDTRSERSEKPLDEPAITEGFMLTKPPQKQTEQSDDQHHTA
jgi:regulator of protease activity HflC (stomatin/prohibitin superfamily)